MLVVKTRIMQTMMKHGCNVSEKRKHTHFLKSILAKIIQDILGKKKLVETDKPVLDKKIKEQKKRQKEVCPKCLNCLR